MKDFLKTLENVFGWRVKPEQLIDQISFTDQWGNFHHDDTDYLDCLAFKGRDWRDLTVEILEHRHSAFSFFLPEAYCYYLPGVMKASLNENNPWLLAIDSMVCIFRNYYEYKDPSWEARRLGLLTIYELDTIKRFLLWVFEFDKGFQDESQSVLAAIEKLKNLRVSD